MKHFAKLLEHLPEYQRLRGGIQQGGTTQLAVGLATIHKAHMIYSLWSTTQQAVHVLAPNEPTALKLCGDINALSGAQTAYFYPSREFNFRPVEGASHEYEHLRIGVLGRLAAGECPIIVSTAESVVQYTLPPHILTERTLLLQSGDLHAIDALSERLVQAGYTRSEQVEGSGQFSVRGGILDFFSPAEALPFRIEFWGEEIDTISTFSTETQRRVSEADCARIIPVREALPGDGFTARLQACRAQLQGKHGALAKQQMDRDLQQMEEGLGLSDMDRYLPLLYKQPATLLDYCGQRIFFVLEPVSIKETLTNASWQQQEDIKLLMAEGILFKGCDTFGIDYTDLIRAIDTETSVILDTFTRSLSEIKLSATMHFTAIQLSVWGGDYSLLKEDLENYRERDYSVVICAGTARACAALAADLTRDKIPAEVVEDISKLIPGRICLLEKTLSAGMEYPDLKLALITHSKTIAPSSQKKRRHKPGKAIRALNDLQTGDFVVHVSHGIGVFEGIVKRDMHGVVKDYIKIRYAGTDTLFVPVTQLDLVGKYIGAAEGANVRLNKLNSVEWQKTRAKVKSAVKDMAKELIALYAKRMNAPGFAFSPDSEWQKEFEARFPYEETDDQLRCIEEIKSDMEKTSPMDRLLCGDVGFGKTEVALRAVFKCVLSGKQCAVLVPTTILAWQHYQTFTRRLEAYPVTVELLSRFKTPKEQEDILKRVKKGEVDILIGTHRIVQKDVHFKSLGLCVVDEEQRFGVAHKEKFKEMRANVDVLTLSATPIPRTLNMAMSGIRDMSLIEEAPQDRHPVQTYVLEHDMGVIAQAIQKELRRNGQVFYLYNHVDSIDSCAAKIHELIPEARIVTAHGKMGEERLSQVWQSLVQHEVDILVCTTIIETGVDIPNCNTLIIENADRFGLSQLYQLRGRVGRSTRRAFAYLTFHKGKALSDIATKRLSAIREFTTFGSGFRIAMRDLEIRGAGNILGAQQHGHMASVGYDLYLKLLGEAVNEEQGKTELLPATECVIDIRLHAHIPESYIQNLSQRIDIYKKIASVQTEEDMLDVTDELIDRFGDPPASVKGLIDVALMRNTASSLGIKEIVQNEDRILLYPEALNMEMASAVAARMKGRVLLSAGSKPYFSVKIAKETDSISALRETLSIMAGQGKDLPFS